MFDQNQRELRGTNGDSGRVVREKGKRKERWQEKKKIEEVVKQCKDNGKTSKLK